MKQRALVVDNEAIMLDLLEKILEKNGYNVTRAADGDQAIKVLNTNYFDLVITDLQMGRTSGFEVIRTTKKKYPSTIAILMTGCSPDSYKTEAFFHGADDYLHKPFSFSDLLKRIQHLELNLVPLAVPS
jgi:DNA-binding response OmpR family regulator